jgi:hypothetical protein
MNIIIKPANRAVVDYGYVMTASRADWQAIAATFEGGHPYITETIEGFGSRVSIHFDAAQLSEIFDAIATLEGL